VFLFWRFYYDGAAAWFVDEITTGRKKGRRRSSNRKNQAKEEKHERALLGY